MSKLITEEDFGNVLMSSIYGKRAFELAKRMAIEFAYWVADHNLDFQTATPENTFIGLDMKRIKGKALFELYQNNIK